MRPITVPVKIEITTDRTTRTALRLTVDISILYRCTATLWYTKVPIADAIKIISGITAQSSPEKIYDKVKYPSMFTPIHPNMVRITLGMVYSLISYSLIFLYKVLSDIPNSLAASLRRPLCFFSAFSINSFSLSASNNVSSTSS